MVSNGIAYRYVRSKNFADVRCLVSQSTTTTAFPLLARKMARLMAIVLLPTPPFPPPMT